MSNNDNKININDEWRDISNIQVNVNNQWRTVSEAYVNVGDSWKQFWNSGYGDKFVFKVQTVGVDDTFTLPLYSGGTYNFTIKWGDGNTDVITAYNDAAVTHTYATQAEYTIQIEGTLSGWRFANDGDCTLMTDIVNWGNLSLGNNNSYFMGCVNMTISATDALNLTGTTNLSNMFTYCTSINGDGILFENAAPTTMLQTFYGCSGLVTLDLSSFDVSNCTTFQNAFYNCSNLVTLNTSGWDVGEATTFNSTFYGCAKLTTVNMSGWTMAKVTSVYRMFSGCSVVDNLDTSSWVCALTGSGFVEAFADCHGLTELDLENIDVSACTSFSWVFHNCNQLTTIGDTSLWDTGAVTTFNAFLALCSSLEAIDVSNWDTSSATSFWEMFYSCSSLTTLDVSGFDTGLATTLGFMFYHVSGVSALDVSGFDLTNCNSIASMFDGCSALVSLDLSLWDVSGITTMLRVFRSCSVLTTIGDVSGWDTGLVETFQETFSGCLDLISIACSGWDTGSCTNMQYMFLNCYDLTGIDIDTWDITSLASANGMFWYANGALTQTNYDDILTGWSAQSTPQSDVVIHFGDAQYSTGAPTTARGVLTSTYNWDITDGGQN